MGEGTSHRKTYLLATVIILGLVTAGVGWRYYYLGLSKSSSPLIADMLLPTSVIPIHYDLTLKAFLPGYGSHIITSKNLTFDAKLIISLKVKEPTSLITVNSKYLRFHLKNCRFDTEDGKHVKIIQNKTDERLEKTQFILENAVPKGRHNITIVYSGQINDHLTGFYRTSYTTPKGEKRIAAATKMEPYYARKMVPCFDEPIYKATWSVAIIHPKGTRAIANGIEEGEVQPEDPREGDFLVSKFKKTPAMSSYLFAVFISDFTFVEGHTKSGIRFRVWTREEASEAADYALQSGIKVLEGYEKLYGINFPLKKQDMVAMPDFVSGAMENWGLITFREALIVYDPKNYNYLNKIRVTNIVAHELSHQWFGNLVTMKWWDDIWLNEGFAAFVQSIGADIISDGELNQEEEFVADQLRQSLELDSRAASHPIIYPISRADEIVEMLDPISYRKGASLLVMIRQLMGKENFDRGIQNYLKKFAYKNADNLEVFSELNKEVPQDVLGPDGKRKFNVTDFSLRYTHQMGYPFLMLDKTNETHYKISQERFKIDPKLKEREKFSYSEYGYKWDVPVWIQYGESKELDLRWLPADGELYIEKLDYPIILNADSYAFARMNYPPSGWEAIFSQLETDHTVYSSRTKYRIIADVFAMAEAEKVNYELAFNVTKYLINEKEFLPWMALSYEMDNFYSYFGSLPQREALKTFIKNLIAPRFYEIDIRYSTRSMADNKGYISARLDTHLWLMYCSADPDSCLSTINLYFKAALDACKNKKAVMSKCGRIHPAIRTHVFNQAVKLSNENYDKMMGFYKRETLQLEKERLLSAMCSTADKKLLNEIMGNVTTPGSTLLRDQDCITAAQFLGKNPLAHNLLFQHLADNWSQVHKKFLETPTHLNKVISHFLVGVQTEKELTRVRAFMEANPNTANYFMFNQSIQKIERRLDWLRKNAQKLEKFLPNVFV